ncbi:CHASE3 domain-containing protein [Herbaspirillum sp.]|uniref:sensor histidine kinase n=1 Tax=Herbaspirillum sp. TaxID=1890675 RepID=UPI001B222230|nr:CHASE3 domain-containing protein [Herbaspirillum sp.]MBO9535415.1 CHASE3 domain-containing protein [Herbaspirillum sp.]
MPTFNQTKLAAAGTAIFFFLALLLSVGVAGFSYYSVRNFEERAVWTQHTHTVLNALEEAHSTLRDIVGSARGYALSGNNEYRGNFEAGVRRLNALMHELRLLMQDDPAQLQRLSAIEYLLEQRLELARKLLELAPQAAQAQLLAGKALSDDIRASFADLKGRENALLAIRSQETADSARVTSLAVLGGSLLSIVLLVAVYRKLRLEMAKRAEAQRKTQAYTAEIEDLYNNAPCGYHAVDETNKTIIKINDTELKWLGYTREQVVGKMTHADLLAPKSAERYTRELLPQLLLKRELVSQDLEYRRADGSVFTALLNATAILNPDNGHLVSRTVIYDISERKHAEEAIETLNADLKRQALHLHNVNKELESFSYSVSHDLRAPLRAISGYAMILEEDFAAALQEKGREQLQVIRRNVRKMDDLINDLLKLAKSTTGELAPERFAMGELVEQVIAGLRRENPHVVFDFDAAAMGSVEANRGLIAQVWENLLSNAIKFSSRSEQPQVRVMAEEGEDEIVYGVHDNGVGFDMRYAHKLFGTFQRLHRQEDFAGTGIGLALVQRIVIRHAGRVWAESRPKEGASFYFSLPTKGLPPGAAEQQ